jgi:hypothetical protein
VVGYDGYIATSPTGMNWTSQQSGVQGFLGAITWTGDRLLVVNQILGSVLSSPDGVHWETLSETRLPWVIDTARDDDALYAVGNYPPTLYSSADSINWSQEEILLGSELWLKIAVGNGRLVAVGPAGAILTREL